MKLFDSMNPPAGENRSYHRRWVSIVPSLMIPGSAQFLSGRRIVGVIWLLVFVALGFARFWMLLESPDPVMSTEARILDGLFFLAWPLLMLDAIRVPIPRIGTRGWVRYILVSLALVILPAFVVLPNLITHYQIPSNGMQPTLVGAQEDSNGKSAQGDEILVDTFTRRARNPLRGDVIVFRTSGLPGVAQDRHFVKRVIGLPNEQIRIEPPYVLAGDQRLLEPEILSTISAATNGYSGFQLAGDRSAKLASENNVIWLGPDEFFVLGDNPDDSLDSRNFGAIARTSIIGRAFMIIAPPERQRPIE